MAYPLDDTLTAGQAGHLTDHQQLHKAHNAVGPKVKADFGAVGDSNHLTGGGTDDSAAFQNAINAAHNSNAGAVLVEPGTYRIVTPLKMFKTDGLGGGIRLLGLGSRNGSGTYGPALVWDGATSSAMLDFDKVDEFMPFSPVENLGLFGRYVVGASAIRYRKRVDFGTDLVRLQFGRWDGPAVKYDMGGPNAGIYDCRWDACKGYSIHYSFATGTHRLTVEKFTVDNLIATTGDPAGFFYGDRSNSDFNNKAILHFNDGNLECNDDLLVTESGATEEADKRGWFQFLTHAAHASLQYLVTYRNMGFDTTSGSIASYSVFQMRNDGATTAAQRGRRIAIVGESLRGMNGDGTAATGHRVPFGNVHANMQPTSTGNPYLTFEHRPTNTEIVASDRAQVWAYTGTD